ncbi:uncharacterized protein LOC144877163 [Branchiostoma floridae x Branchiostoma japonicum]
MRVLTVIFLGCAAILAASSPAERNRKQAEVANLENRILRTFKAVDNTEQPQEQQRELTEGPGDRNTLGGNENTAVDGMKPQQDVREMLGDIFTRSNTGTPSWSASSQFDSYYSADRADINTHETADKAGAWAAATNNLDQWLMRDLGEVKVVTGIITKGRNYSPDWPSGPHYQYVTSYVISYGVENGDEKFYTNAENEIIVFAGNSDRDGEVRHDFRNYSGPDALMARFIKIHPRTWHEHISMRVKIVTSAPSWSASSQFDSYYSADRADINTHETADKAGAWAAATNNLDQWLMRDLGEVKVVTGIITKGRNYSPDWPSGPHYQYVTSYVISYGVENGDEKFYTNAENEIIVFAGNSDRDGEVRHDFRNYSGPDALMARFIKIHPRTWHEHISMRVKIVTSAPSWSASSQFDSYYSADRADINTHETADKAGAWAAATNNLDQWLMRDLGEVKVVTGIITKGRNYSPDWPSGPHYQYVTSYVISYGVENGDEKFYTNAENEIIVFAGNSDRDGEVRHDFRNYSGPDALMARFIKIHPRTWHEHISMRVKIVTSDIDGCAGDPCDANADCTDVPAPGTGQDCTCNAGYEGDGYNCTDIEGCAGDPCDANAACTDVPAPGTGQDCTCNAGYEGDGYTCTDVDGCAGDPCDANADCTDVPAPGTGQDCTCNAGYEGDGYNCTDIDGCAGHPCDANADCTDVPAPGTGQDCRCNAGYEGDGYNCTDVDGCAGDPCDANSDCTDVPAPGTGQDCTCNAGYEGDGYNCTDIDGCAGDPCDANAACTDVPAPGTGQDCTCNAGYEGDGYTCTGTCQVESSNRQDCGYHGISPIDCNSRGCCYGSSAPWCFFKKDACQVESSNRQDCGYPGISPTDCHSRGCCYGSSNIPSATGCFFKKGACQVESSDRQDCGYPGISPNECHSRGCCYGSSTIPSATGCFFQKV